MTYEEFEKLMIHEHKSLSRPRLFETYNELMKEKILKENFVLVKYPTWGDHGGQIEQYTIDDYAWDLFWYQSELINLKALREKLRNKFTDRSRDTIDRHIDVILDHLIPSNEKILAVIKLLLEKKKKDLAKKYKVKPKADKFLSVEQEQDGGVYGIYENKKLVYIGMTTRPFENRWMEHMKNFRENSKELSLYSLLDPEAEIEFKKLIEVKKIPANKVITKHDIEVMELALIQLYKPPYNFAGRSSPYVFSSRT